MKTNKNESDDSVNAADRDRCLAYLLGQMSASESSEFESALSDERLAETLLRESDLLLQISSAALPCPAKPLPCSAKSLPCSGEATSDSVDHRLIAWIIATAAALMIAATTYWFTSGQTETTTIANVTPTPSMPTPGTPALDLDVANEWARNSGQWSDFDSDPSVELISMVSLDEMAANDQGNLSLDESETEDALEWMMIAFETSNEAEQSNDG